MVGDVVGARGASLDGPYDAAVKAHVCVAWISRLLRCMAVRARRGGAFVKLAVIADARRRARALGMAGANHALTGHGPVRWHPPSSRAHGR